ncbi:MAG: hypothetical protein K9L89_06290 [Kiritimatiellales bacterium]|nr:hypothetical protein [Kiritimatiellales bacterium]
MAMAFLGTAAGTMLHSFFDFEMHVFQNALIFSLLAAIAAGPLCGRRQEIALRKNEDGMRSRRMYLVRIALALLTVAGLILAIPVFSSALICSAADRLADARQPEKAKDFYQLAIKIDASNWRACKGLGNVYHNQRYYSLDMAEKKEVARLEREIFAEGYRHNPMDAELVMGLGKATLFLGDVDAGLDLLKQGTILRPFNDLYWWTLGVEQRKAGRYAAALETFRYAQTLNNSPSTRKNIQWLEKKLNAPATPVSTDAVQTGQHGNDDPKETELSELHRLMGSF